jgi:hypothetical protein
MLCIRTQVDSLILGLGPKETPSCRLKTTSKGGTWQRSVQNEARENKRILLRIREVSFNAQHWKTRRVVEVRAAANGTPSLTSTCNSTYAARPRPAGVALAHDRAFRQSRRVQNRGFLPRSLQALIGTRVRVPWLQPLHHDWDPSRTAVRR